MKAILTSPLLALASAVLAHPVAAQLPDGSLAVAAFQYPGVPGAAGLYYVEPSTGAVTTVTGLPCELVGTCAGSVGSNCVVRDPRSERLLVGNAVLNGGSIGAWLLTMQGSTVVSSVSCTVGAVPSFDMGVNAAAFLPDGDVLLAVGRVVSGPNAYRPIVRWTPPATGSGGTFTAVPLPALHASTGNLCNALVVDAAGETAFAVCKSNGLFGQFMTFDLLVVPLDGSPVTVVASGLQTGEFVTQLFWDCNGDLLGATAQYPLGVGGRLVRWTRQSGTWTPAGSQYLSGLYDFNAAVDDPSSCEQYVAPLDPVTGAVGIHRLGVNGPVSVVPSPWPWAAIAGIEVNPNPEVLEHASGVTPTASWSYRPFSGGMPSVGNLAFTLPLATGPAAGLAVAFVDFARGPGLPLLGLDVFLTPTAAPLAAEPSPDPQWSLPLPNQPVLVGVELFAQALLLDAGGLGASDLLQLRIR